MQREDEFLLSFSLKKITADLNFSSDLLGRGDRDRDRGVGGYKGSRFSRDDIVRPSSPEYKAAGFLHKQRVFRMELHGKMMSAELSFQPNFLHMHVLYLQVLS